MITPSALFEKFKGVSLLNPLCAYTMERCEKIAPQINRILELKKEKNALILAHSYVHPDIIYGVADHVGDSYGLAKIGKMAPADLIVFPSVRFMAETVKILSPQKTVIDPNPNGGCSLADSIAATQVKELRKKYPKHTFVCYINTTASVKAECDVCVTSSNVIQIIEKIPSDKIYFLPDKLMGENAKNLLQKRGVHKEILTYPGTCYVHEEFDAGSIDLIRSQNKDALVLAHPECKPEVVAKADVVGSTTQMQNFVMQRQKENRPFVLLTECGVASRLAMEAPLARVIGGCTMCKYMRSNSLASIIEALESPRSSQIIEIESSTLERASICLERMFHYAE
ncbi:MAG: quinolinate synthase [Chlamydiae bacterium RIFCSPHIGHO2_12_FULL_49_9]|nr:MAG: quinolinate synthase [Chlamydiae bacterium RIFCSPHIGHO2_12_FULL_49_9]